MKVFLGFWMATFASTCLVSAAQAQVLPDSTLNTIVTRSGNVFTIDNGTTSGTNLFHSFREFSIPTGGTAIFNNAPTIQNIFSRVTGSTASNIDGTIQANGTANLFLLNPAGILFGANAALNIGGSFIGTTAQSIKFVDGVEFSAVNLGDRPLLTMSVPIGLQMGNNSGAIRLNGSQLKLPAQKTLAFLGNEVTLTKSRLTVVDGYVNIGSVASNSNIGLALNPWQFDYKNVNQFNNITLTNATTVNTSGTSGGPIALQGKAITLSQGSMLTSHTSGILSGKGISLKGSESVVLQGIPTSSTNTAIAAHSQVAATGKSGDVIIEAPYLRMTNGAAVDLRTFGVGDAGNIIIKVNEFDITGEAINPVTKQRLGISTLASNTVLGSVGRGGNITIDATEVNIRDGAELRASARGKGDGGNIRITADQLNVTGESATGEPAFLTGITTSNREYATGRGGDISLNVRKIAVLDGPGIRTGTYGEGASGNIFVNAEEVTIAGSSSKGISSRFFSSTNGNYDFTTQRLIRLDKGRGGNIMFNVNTLNLLDGGRISTSTETFGPAGELSIQARSVNIAGASRRTATNLLYSLDATGPSALSASSTGPGNAGSIYVSSQGLNLSDRGEIVVNGQGLGDSGNIWVQSDAIRLDQSAKLRAEVTVGSQGNVNLTASTLRLRRGSFISVNAAETANGGNISLNIPIVLGLENSDIIANASQGRGGNINITTQGIIGLQFRNTLTPQQDPTNDITASSEFNVNGSVQINNIGADPNSGVVALPVDVVDLSQQIAKGCDAAQGSSFVITGRGGTSVDPTQQVKADRPWSDLRAIQPTEKAIATRLPLPEHFAEATTWAKDPQTGEVQILAAYPRTNTPVATCGAIAPPT